MNKPRLIDANELYKAVSDGKYTTGNIFKDMELQDFIKSMPTAYDIDKVVEQLEEIAELDLEQFCIDSGNCVKNCNQHRILYAIEIVKGGQA